MTDAPPTSFNLSTSASTTAYHSATPSSGQFGSYTQSIHTGAGNTFGTSQFSAYGPAYVTSTFPGSDGGTAATAAASAGSSYRWKSGVISLTPQSCQPAHTGKPQRLLTRHTVAPLLPTSEELLRRELADVSASLVDDPCIASCSPAGADPSSGGLLCAAEELGKTGSSVPLRRLLQRCVRQDGSFYMQQVQIRCKSATVLPRPCDVHSTVHLDCAACRGNFGATAAMRSSRRRLSPFPEATTSTPHLPRKQWRWTDNNSSSCGCNDCGGSVPQLCDTVGSSGHHRGACNVVAERCRLAGSGLAAIAGTSPFTASHPVRGVSRSGGSGNHNRPHSLPMDGHSSNSNVHVNAVGDARTVSPPVATASTRDDVPQAAEYGDTTAEGVHGRSSSSSSSSDVGSDGSNRRGPQQALAGARRSGSRGSVVAGTSARRNAASPHLPLELPQEDQQQRQQLSTASSTSHPQPAESSFASASLALATEPQRRGIAGDAPTPQSIVDHHHHHDNGSNLPQTKAPAMSLGCSSVTTLSSLVSVPLVHSAVASQHHLVGETVHFQEPLPSAHDSAMASEYDSQDRFTPSTPQPSEVSWQTSTKEEAQPEQRRTPPPPPQLRSVAATTRGGFIRLALTIANSQRRVNPLNAVHSSLRSSTSAGQPRERNGGAAAASFTPAFVTTPASNTLVGSVSDWGCRNAPPAFISATPVTATTSLGSPLVFRTMQPALPSAPNHTERPQPAASPQPSPAATLSSGDAAATASTSTSHEAESAVGDRRPLSQQRSPHGSFAVAATSSPSGFLSFGAVRPTATQQLPSCSVASSPVSSTPITGTGVTPLTTTAAAAAPPPLPSMQSFLTPALSCLEDRTSLFCHTTRQQPTTTTMQPGAPSLAFHGLSSFSSSLTSGVPRAAAATTPDTGSPSAPRKNISDSVAGWEADESWAAVEAAVATPVAPPTAEPDADNAMDGVKDMGVLLVVPAGIAVISNTSVATDRFGWSTTAPPDAALAVVERRVRHTVLTDEANNCCCCRSSVEHATPCDVDGTCSTPARGFVSSVSSSEVVERVVTYFPVHTDVLKQGGYFAALFGDSGSPYVRSAPDEYVDFADLPRTTTETVLLVGKTCEEAASEAHPFRRCDGQWDKAEPIKSHRCSRGRRWASADDVKNSFDNASRSSSFVGHMQSWLPFSAHPDALAHAVPPSCCVPVYYVRGPGCDGDAFTQEPWRHPSGGDSVAESVDGPGLTATGVAQLIRYFYTGALPLFFSYGDILNARSGLLETTGTSGFARQFAEIFSIAYYTSLNSLTHAMLNVLWRLMSITRDVLPIWRAAVEWHLPDMQALCEQWIEKHLKVLLRTNTQRGLWRGLRMSYVQLLVELRMAALREAKKAQTGKPAAVTASPVAAAASSTPREAPPLRQIRSSTIGDNDGEGGDVAAVVAVVSTAPLTDGPLSHHHNSWNNSSTSGGAAEGGGGGAGGAVTTANTRTASITSGTASYVYSWSVYPGQPQPSSLGIAQHPLLPPAYNSPSSPDAEVGSSSITLRTTSTSPSTFPVVRPASFPALPASHPSRHFGSSPVIFFASSRRAQAGPSHSEYSSTSLARPTSVLTERDPSTSQQLSLAAVWRSDRRRSRSHCVSSSSEDVRGNDIVVEASSGGAAAAARPVTPTTTATLFIPAAAAAVPPPRSAPSSSPLMPQTPPWPASAGRGSAGSPVRASNSTDNANYIGGAAQQFWSDTWRPGGPGTATNSAPAAAGTQSSTPLAFEVMNLEDSSVAAVSPGWSVAVTPALSTGSSSPAVLRDERWAGVGEQQQQQREVVLDRRASGAASVPRSHPVSGSDLSVAAVSASTSSSYRNTYIDFHASPVNNTAALPPNLHSSFATAAAASSVAGSRVILDDSRFVSGLHYPHGSNNNSSGQQRQQHSGHHRPNLNSSSSSTPRMRSVPSASFSGTSWMVVPPTLQLLADGAWRIGGYGRLYTAESREALEERQTAWLRAEREQQDCEGRALDEVLLSEAELLERLWTWWTSHTRDAACSGRSVDAEKRALMASMLREAHLNEVQAVAFSSAKASPGLDHTLLTMLEEVQEFLHINPPPLIPHRALS
jgi:hypothetical protein